MEKYDETSLPVIIVVVEASTVAVENLAKIQKAGRGFQYESERGANRMCH